MNAGAQEDLEDRDVDIDVEVEVQRGELMGNPD